MKAKVYGSRKKAGASRSSFASALFAGLLAGMCSFSAFSGVTIDSKPLTVANAVPGNMVLVPSFEWPTAITHANDPGKTEANTTYASATTYSGYFNPDVCYDYVYSTTEANRYFKPVAKQTSRTCTGTGWSGNFLNWASAQAVDTFRMALTGGYRVKDDASGNTWLEKAESDRYFNTYNDFRKLTSGASGVMPGTFASLRTRIGGLHDQMFFIGNSSGGIGSNATLTIGNGLLSGAGLTNVIPYGWGEADNAVPSKLFANAAQACPSGYTWTAASADCRRSSPAPTVVAPTAWGNNVVFAVSMRVQVCDDGEIDDRPFCKQYGSHWKPEGLIQQNAQKLRFSVFGYQTSDLKTEGALLRARQKFVGPSISGEKLYPDLAENTRRPMDNAEWSGTTGVFFDNPDSADATATSTDIGTGTCTRPDGTSGNCSIAYSGVVNYINRAGQINTGNTIPLKGGYGSPVTGYNGGADNVSDLYYTALRYLRGQGGETGGYGNFLLSSDYGGSGNTVPNKYKRSDGMPAIRNWYGTGNETGVAWAADQAVGSNYDPMLYQCQASVLLGIGDTNSNEAREPNSTGAKASGDPSDWVALMKGDGASGPGINGNKNAIAGLAYWAHLNDLRTDIPNTEVDAGKYKGQSISTYWVDVVELNAYKTNTTNQYYLATKYGGYTIPTSSYTASGNASEESQAWWTSTTNRPAWTGQTSTTPGSFYQPSNMFFANNGQAMIDSLTQAFSKIIDDITGSGGSFASNTTRLETGVTTYQAKYQSNGWSGQLIATSIDVNTGSLATTPDWRAETWLAGTTANDYSKRKILFNNSGTLQNFISNWNNYTVLASPTITTPSGLATTNAAQLKYLLGDRSGERQSGGAFRNRRSMLGDIINSQPVYAGTPNASLYPDDTAYATFLSAQSSRTKVVYVGANDGLLHAFNAGTGTEIFAFMPTAAMAVLTQNDASTNKFPNWSPDYDHAYSMDGELTVADVKISGTWKTVLVGSMGRGGKSVFALDVTTPASPTLLWEKTSADIGNVLGKPIIANTAAGWKVYLGNGPNSTNGGSKLISIDISTGTVTAVAAGTGADNGLGPVNIWDNDKDGVYDTAYAGDMSGDVYKFNLVAGTSSKLFAAAGTGQPVTVQPLVARNPYSPTQTWVFFGTGRYLSLSDTTSTANAVVQAWYGIIDSGSLISGKSELEQVKITAENAIGRVIQDNPGLDTGKRGWYMDLKLDGGAAKGERMVVPNFFQGLTLIGTTRYPDSSDPCSPSGKGYTMAINPFTGGRLGAPFFDNDNSGTVGNSGDFNNGVPYSGITYNSGPNNPIFIGDVMYTSLDDGSSKVTKTSSSQGSVRRVSWRELLNGG